MIAIKEKYLLLLEICLKNHRKDLLYLIHSKELMIIDEAVGNELRDVVGDELMIRGFDGDIPNAYGLALEELIDELGHFFLDN